MADVFEVANALADLIDAQIRPLAGTLYTISAPLDAAAFGQQTVPAVTTMAGTPTLKEIMNRLEAGKAMIGVEYDETYASAPQYLTTDFFDQTSPPIPVLTVSVAGAVATIGGSIQVGDVLGVTQGSLGAGYAVTAADTLLTVAINLATAANAAGILAGASGATVTLASNQVATFNIGTTYTRMSEVWRRRKPFYVTLHAANVYDRSFIGKIIEATLAPATRITMPDKSVATILYASDGFDSVDFDEQQRDMAYIRRTRTLVDFLTTQTVSATQIVATGDTITVGAPTNTAPTVQQL